MSSRPCHRCGESMPDNAKFCPGCGAAVPPDHSQPRFCPQCGSELAEGARFCHQCGWRTAPAGGGAARRSMNRVTALLVVLALAAAGFAGLRLFWPDAASSDASGAPGSSQSAPWSSHSITTADWRDNRLMADPPQEDSSSDAPSWSALGGPVTRGQVASVTFLDSLENLPEGAWDVSAGKDGSVQAWTEENGERYDLFIAAPGGMAAPEDCTGLFMGYENTEAIRFNSAFHTENTTSMQSMFQDCRSLEELDVSGFDTAQVTTMSSMFDYCQALEELDVSGFDTAQVTDMSTMFNYCEKLDGLDVSGFDTARVTNLLGMFSGCKSLSSLDVSSFDTGSATVMSYMFCECQSLETLDVKNWDISNVTAMAGMFSLCPRLSSLDASGWDVSHVTHTRHILSDTPATAASCGITGLPASEDQPAQSGGSGTGNRPSSNSGNGGSTGGSDIITSDRERTCSACFGAGELDCSECGGDGRVTCSYCGGAGGEYELDLSTPLYDGVGTGDRGRVWEDCSRCRGSGEQDCRTCLGRGTVDCWGC